MLHIRKLKASARARALDTSGQVVDLKSLVHVFGVLRETTRGMMLWHKSVHLCGLYISIAGEYLRLIGIESTGVGFLVRQFRTGRGCSKGRSYHGG